LSGKSDSPGTSRYDRSLLLHGSKRDEVLSLCEVQRYGTDSFGDQDYIKLYGLTPAQWYARGVRMLGRTAVECTRDELGDRIGRDIAAVAAAMPSRQQYTVIDPFAGSCNTLFWVLHHLPNSQGVAFELDPQVYELTASNVASLQTPIKLHFGDYQSLLPDQDIPPVNDIVAFLAPPWGKALDETKGLDLRGTIPPIAAIIRFLDRIFSTRRLLVAVQVYEKIDPVSLAQVQGMLEWSELRIYDLNAPGKNHGLLMGTKRWRPQVQPATGRPRTSMSGH
jgi:hypothetical protein